MKNYSPSIAAQRLVQANTIHGLSRHAHPDLARTSVTSVLTEKSHIQALKKYAQWLHQNRTGKHLKNSNESDAAEYLSQRAACRSQSTVDLDRQAINLHLQPQQPLQFVASAIPTVQEDRAYTMRQIDLLLKHANDSLALSIKLAVDAGLRSMELVTICAIDRLSPSPRAWDSSRFAGRQGTGVFAVHGKGGLIREVRVAKPLADQLLGCARPLPLRVSHRGAHLQSHFELVAGHPFCIQFGRLSQQVLGFSHGAHGLRHSFAQRRRIELMCCGFSHERSVEILSQELGHFSTTNTWAYLRD